MKNNVVLVKLWGRTVGYLYWNTAQKAAVFEYDPRFVQEGPDIAPLIMSIRSERSRRQIAWIGNRDKLYQGLPPSLADSLPDKWGDSVFHEWLNRQHIPLSHITSVDRLSFIGSRGMGALEYEPAYGIGKEDFGVDVHELYLFARSIMKERAAVALPPDRELLWQDLVKIGTSAGGKRPKAIIALNRTSGEIRSGQADVAPGFEHCILKLDEGSGYPSAKIEYAYWRMAESAGIRMMPCEILERGGTTHFLTGRFDRDGNRKIHTQTLAALWPDATGYEDVFAVMRKLGLPYGDMQQMFRLMVFNVLAGNIDDHTKNISFRMAPDGTWSLAPAYDLTFTIDPSAPGYMNRHSLSVNGKVEGITLTDLYAVAEAQEISGYREIVEQASEAVEQFPALAEELEIPETYTKSITGTLAERNPGDRPTHTPAVSKRKKSTKQKL